MPVARVVLAAVVALGLVASPVAMPAQAPALEALLTRVAEYVGDLTPRLANVVAVETYEQRTTVRVQGAPSGGAQGLQGFSFGDGSGSVVWRLRSDFLLVRYRMAELEWMVFRDVAEVDGKVLDRPKDRLVALFAAPNVDTQRAAVIALESRRFHIPGGSFAVTNPLLVVALMQEHYQPRLRFTLGGNERVGQPGSPGTLRGARQATGPSERPSPGRAMAATAWGRGARPGQCVDRARDWANRKDRRAARRGLEDRDHPDHLRV